MKAVLRKRLIPGAIATLMVLCTVFTGSTATAKGDGVFNLTAGSADDTISVADDKEFVEMNLHAGVAGVVDIVSLSTQEEFDEYKEQVEAE
ncbi:MAG: hypothetical protein IKI20_06760, partial [Lachnospiraceae bacterium]|nr:hypothetical protein [Lachnospiraceae bacterium]